MPVPTGVVSTLFAPPIGLQSPILDEDGPFTAGDHTITTFLTTTAHGLLPAGTWPIGGTYGVVVLASTIPLPFGYSIGYDSGGPIGGEGYFYFERFAQVVVMHQALGGSYVTVQTQDCNLLQQYIPLSFTPGGGDRIGLHVTTACAVELFFMCLLA